MPQPQLKLVEMHRDQSKSSTETSRNRAELQKRQSTFIDIVLHIAVVILQIMVAVRIIEWRA